MSGAPTIYDHSRAIGDILEDRFPRLEQGAARLIRIEHVDAIAEEITGVVAEILQSWLDAGSEREVTLEELYDPIRQHILGWTDHPDHD